MSLAELRSALSDRYTLERELGQGGMATVYLAQDLRHHRQVAIKVLRPELAAVIGAERFLAEIRTTANLQHPHILPLFDSGTVDGTVYYVMPYVTGESLRDRLDREKQLSIADAVRVTTEVASALDYAHRHGVIHRDIKPENILLHDRQALVADFGIALAASRSDGGSRMTGTGMSLGTPTYMSPEQATADKEITGQSDIYSLASVCYEMLCGVPPHDGNSAQQIIMKVVAEEAVPVTKLRKSVPPNVAAAIDIALEKLPADRFSTMSEFAISLQQPTSRTIERARSWRQDSAATNRWHGRLLTGALAMILGVIVGWLALGNAPEGPRPTRFWNLALPSALPMALTGPGPLGIWQSALALAPSGDVLAYVTPRGSSTALVIHSVASDSAVVISGTDGAYHPFFSPDGRWVAFFSGNELRKVSTAGGAPVTLASVERPVGATWPSPERILLFEHDGFQLRWVSPAGGIDSVASLSTQFGTPDVLPGGEWAVGQISSGQLALLSLTDLTMLAITRRGVVPLDQVQIDDLLFGTSPRYVRTGHLVYGGGDGVVMALSFDAQSRQVLGEARPVVSGVRIEEGFGFAEYAIASDGTMVYAPGLNQLYGSIAYINPDGRFDTLPLPRGQYTQPRISPDGSLLAVQLRKPVGGWDVLIIDLETGVRRRVPVPGNYRAFPASWAPDGRTLMIGLWDPAQFLARGATLYSLDRGSWEPVKSFGGSYMSIAPNGKDFVFSDWKTGEIFIRALRGDTTSHPIPGRGFAASFSPDGRWLAWGNLDGGISVSSVPPTGQIFTVADRGQQPLWSPDGRRLIYRDGRYFQELSVSTTNGFRTGRPSLIGDGAFIRTFAWNHTLAPDGRLLAMVSTPEESATTLGVITGFDRLLLRLAPKASKAPRAPATQ